MELVSFGNARLEHDEHRRIAFRFALQVILECPGLVGFDGFRGFEEKLFDLADLLMVLACQTAILVCSCVLSTYSVCLAGFGRNDCDDVNGHDERCGGWCELRVTVRDIIIHNCKPPYAEVVMMQFSALPWMVRAEKCRGTFRDDDSRLF